MSSRRPTNGLTKVAPTLAASIAWDAEKTSVSYAVQIGEQQALAKSGQLEGALQNLLALEKPARLVRAS